MKINLYGEFSGLHHGLALGLRELGHDVLVYSSGDMRKGYPADISLRRGLGGRSGQIAELVSAVATTIREADLGQVISPLVLDGGWALRGPASDHLVRRARRHTETLVMAAAGSDHFWLRHARRHFGYFPFDADDEYYSAPFNQVDNRDRNLRLAQLVNAVCAYTPEYHAAYEHTDLPRVHRLYDLPMVGCPLTSSEPAVRRDRANIRVLFGANKKRFKGAGFIEPALAAVAAACSDVEIIAPEMVSYEQWVRYVRDCDVLVDQCRSYSYGINALYGMAFGKLVLTGWEWGNTTYAGMGQPPVINIRPSIDDIREKLLVAVEVIRSGRHDVQQVARYYDTHHAPVAVARKFLAAVGKRH